MKKPHAAFTDTEFGRCEGQLRIKWRLSRLRHVFALPAEGIAIPCLACAMQLPGKLAYRWQLWHHHR